MFFVATVAVSVVLLLIMCAEIIMTLGIPNDVLNEKKGTMFLPLSRVLKPPDAQTSLNSLSKTNRQRQFSTAFLPEVLVLSMQIDKLSMYPKIRQNKMCDANHS